MFISQGLSSANYSAATFAGQTVSITGKAHHARSLDSSCQSRALSFWLHDAQTVQQCMRSHKKADKKTLKSIMRIYTPRNMFLCFSNLLALNSPERVSLQHNNKTTKRNRFTCLLGYFVLKLSIVKISINTTATTRATRKPQETDCRVFLNTWSTAQSNKLKKSTQTENFKLTTAYNIQPNRRSYTSMSFRLGLQTINARI